MNQVKNKAWRKKRKKVDRRRKIFETDSELICIPTTFLPIVNKSVIKTSWSSVGKIAVLAESVLSYMQLSESRKI